MIQPLLAAALLLAQAPAAKPCISKAEAADLALFLMPSVIQGAAQKCRSNLPRGAFLTTASRPLAERLRREGGNRWSSVKDTIERMTGNELPGLLGETTQMRIAEATGAAAVLKEVETQDCATIDAAVEALSPLPAANFGRMFALALEVSGRDADSRMPFTICPARPA
jgi:hypothetical protein